MRLHELARFEDLADCARETPPFVCKFASTLSQPVGSSLSRLGCLSPRLFYFCALIPSLRLICATAALSLSTPRSQHRMSAPFDPAAAAASPSVANCVVVPRLPDHINALTAHSLLHLKVGMLNVAYSAGGASHSGLFTPPINQPLTLPLSLHLHPALLPAAATSVSALAHTGADRIDDDSELDLSSWTPPGVWRLQSSVVPSILSHLPEMIAQIKVKKMDKLRGNRVGIRRTQNLVFTFAFKETQPAYHMLTVSARRIRQMDRDSDAKAKARAGAAGAAAASAGVAAAPAALPGASLSSQLSSFSLFDDPSVRVQLQPLSECRAPEGRADEGYYAGQGFASYLVSKHTLHVRAMPTARALASLQREREQEAERRRAQLHPAAAFDARPQSDADEMERVRTAGAKRKQHSHTDAAAVTSHAAAGHKKARHSSSSALDDASAQVAAAASPTDLEAEEPSTDELPAQACSDFEDDWLNMDL